MNRARIIKALKGTWQAEKHLSQVVAKEIKPGNRVSYRHGDQKRFVEVVEVRGQVLLVRGVTEVEYRLDVYRIFEVAELYGE